MVETLNDGRASSPSSAAVTSSASRPETTCQSSSSAGAVRAPAESTRRHAAV
ncbi:MAG: hypothetical protein AB7R55_16395 [Gemmatimonadales bacterium]